MMPRQGVALVVRPNFDKATSYGHYYMGLAAAYVSGNMAVVDLSGSDANRQNIFASLEEVDPVFCYMLGHGNPDTYSAQYKETVMVTCNGDERLIGRVVLLLSCSCGVRLAPSAVSKGATAVFAWEVDFTWVAIEDPATDPYAVGFFESVNAISDALAYGKMTREAMDLSTSKWNSWIDYWASSIDPYAGLVIQHMIHNRDGQRLFGSASARVTAPAISPPEVGKIPVPIPLLAGFNLLFLSLLLL